VAEAATEVDGLAVVVVVVGMMVVGVVVVVVVTVVVVVVAVLVVGVVIVGVDVDVLVVVEVAREVCATTCVGCEDDCLLVGTDGIDGSREVAGLLELAGGGIESASTAPSATGTHPSGSCPEKSTYAKLFKTQKRAEPPKNRSLVHRRLLFGSRENVVVIAPISG
jgi:hypothetical protein